MTYPNYDLAVTVYFFFFFSLQTITIEITLVNMIKMQPYSINFRNHTFLFGAQLIRNYLSNKKFIVVVNNSDFLSPLY